MDYNNLLKLSMDFDEDNLYCGFGFNTDTVDKLSYMFGNKFDNYFQCFSDSVQEDIREFLEHFRESMRDTSCSIKDIYYEIGGNEYDS